MVVEFFFFLILIVLLLIKGKKIGKKVNCDLIILFLLFFWVVSELIGIYFEFLFVVCDIKLFLIGCSDLF